MKNISIFQLKKKVSCMELCNYCLVMDKEHMNQNVHLYLPIWVFNVCMMSSGLTMC